MHVEISTEALVYWYLRLNGYLTITNFILISTNPQESI